MDVFYASLEPRRIRAFPDSAFEVVLMEPIVAPQSLPQHEPPQSPPQTPIQSQRPLSTTSRTNSQTRDSTTLQRDPSQHSHPSATPLHSPVEPEMITKQLLGLSLREPTASSPITVSSSFTRATPTLTTFDSGRDAENFDNSPSSPNDEAASNFEIQPITPRQPSQTISLEREKSVHQSFPPEGRVVHTRPPQGRLFEQRLPHEQPSEQWSPQGQPYEPWSPQEQPSEQHPLPSKGDEGGSDSSLGGFQSRPSSTWTEGELTASGNQILTWITTFNALKNDFFNTQYPRLFVILPTYRISYRFNPFFHPFRIHYLCEHGQYTDWSGPTPSPFEVHLTNSLGYDVENPNQFLEGCGAYVLRVLQVVKHGTIFPYATSPYGPSRPLSHEEQAISAPHYSRSEIIQFIDDAMTVLQDRTRTMTTTSENPPSSRGYHGAQVQMQSEAEFKRLGTHIVENVIWRANQAVGNLFRVVKDGVNVKWICRFHHDLEFTTTSDVELFMYLKATESPVVNWKGELTLSIHSLQFARRLYRELETTKGMVSELKLTLDWKVTADDLDALEYTVVTSDIVALDLTILEFHGENVYGNADAIVRMMTNGKLQRLTLSGWPKWLPFESFIPERPTTSTLRVLYLKGYRFLGDSALKLLFRVYPCLNRVKMCQNMFVGQPSMLEVTPTVSVSKPYPVYRLAVQGELHSLSGAYFTEIPLVDWSQITELTMPATNSVKWFIPNILSVNPHLRSITVDYTKQPYLLDIIGVCHTAHEQRHQLQYFAIRSPQFFDIIVTKLNYGTIEKVSVIRAPGVHVNRISILDGCMDIKVSTSDSWPWCDALGNMVVNHWDNLREATVASLLHRLPQPILVSIDCTFMQNPEIVYAAKRVITLFSSAPMQLKLAGDYYYSWLPELHGFTTHVQPLPNLRRLTLVGFHAAMIQPEEFVVEWLLATVVNLNQMSTFERLELNNVQLSPLVWHMLLTSIYFQPKRMLILSGTNIADLQLALLEDIIPMDIGFTLSITSNSLSFSEMQVQSLKSAFVGRESKLQLTLMMNALHAY